MSLVELDLIERPSPNNDARARDAVVDTLVLHYTGMQTTDEALDRLCDPEASVSAHYLINEDGKVFRMVPEVRRAWHAGVSSWAGDTDINDRSIGIELSNRGHEFGYRPFPEPQIVALENLCLDILTRHAIPARRVLGHSDVAPSRKQDPGEFLDWRRLARRGVGVWPELRSTPRGGTTLGPGDNGGKVAEAQSALAAFGYGLIPNGEYDDQTTDVVVAFQRHFRPRVVDGAYDPETAAILRAVIRLLV
jgi:N-acetylmuramoyl-L-alanine amidase